MQTKLNTRARWLMCSVLWLGISCVTLAQPAPGWVDVTRLGAVSDTSVVSTRALQDAIDSCYVNGGGTVYIPPGQYKSGTLVLKDHVTLYLASGATLYASRDIEDYVMPLENATRPVFLYANGAKNIGIRGHGTIHGGAKRRYEDLRKVDGFIEEITENARAAGVEMKQYYIVPPDVSLVIFTDCQDIHIEDVTLKESSFWTLHLIKSERIVIHGIKVFSSLESGVNADGIDINSCRDVVVSDCIVETGDDAIVLKTWYDEPCENVTVTNCVLRSSSSALKLGTESRGDFRRIVFSNCAIEQSNRGLAIVVRNGGTVEDVLFSNITIECTRRHFNWWGNGDPIWIYVTRKNERFEAGTVRNVVFENIIARGMGTSCIESTEGTRIHDITLRNVQLTMQAENYVDKRADHALVAQDVDGLVLSDVTVSWDDNKPENRWGSALRIERARRVRIDGFSGRQGLIDGTLPAVSLNDVEDATVMNSHALSGTTTFLNVSGSESKDIVIQHNDLLGRSSQLIEVDASVKHPETIKVK